MSETWVLVLVAVAGLAAIAVYVFAWRATSRASMAVKALVRGGLAAVILAPVAALILLPDLQRAEKSAAEAERRFEYRYEPPKPAAQKRVARPRTRSGAPRGGTSAPRSAPSAPGGGITGYAPPAPSAAPSVGAGPDAGATVAAAPEPEAAAPIPEAAAPPPAASNGDTASRRMAPETDRSPAADDASGDWDLVPVFYGTDRARADNAERLDYGGARGRRLELGHAMVSVPKSHQVPNVERPWALTIPYFNLTIYEEAEDPNKHFVMQEIKALSRDEFLSLVRQRLAKSDTFKNQAFIFVHGFNTSFENGVYRTAQISYDLKFDGAPFLYSWPSGGGVASYTYDRESSGQSRPYMRDFMKLVINETGAKAVSVIAHSMGNQPVLQVLKDLKNATPDDVIISQVILAAPDVDRDNFENIAKEILGLAKGVTLYVAANDQALEFSRRFHGGVPRAGDVPLQGPLVIDGIDTIDVTAASTDSLGINHSGYAENNALLNDIGKLIATGATPQNRNPPIFERIDRASGAYWRYPSAN